MATNLMINVSPNFNLYAMGDEIANIYRAQGFVVNVMRLNNTVTLQFDKGCGGINTLLGMGLGITASCTLQNNSLTVTYSNEEWTGKIIGLVAGWFLCLIPFITAIIGVVNQSSLSKKINTDITMIASRG